MVYVPVKNPPKKHEKSVKYHLILFLKCFVVLISKYTLIEKKYGQFHHLHFKIKASRLVSTCILTKKGAVLQYMPFLKSLKHNSIILVLFFWKNISILNFQNHVHNLQRMFSLSKRDLNLNSFNCSFILKKYTLKTKRLYPTSVPETKKWPD